MPDIRVAQLVVSVFQVGLDMLCMTAANHLNPRSSSRIS